MFSEHSTSDEKVAVLQLNVGNKRSHRFWHLCPHNSKIQCFDTHFKLWGGRFAPRSTNFQLARGRVVALGTSTQSIQKIADTTTIPQPEKRIAALFVVCCKISGSLIIALALKGPMRVSVWVVVES